MVNKRIETSDIYDNINQQIIKLINAIKVESDDDMIVIAQKHAFDKLSDSQKAIANEYEDLKKNTEWKRFTIAFYGETNAGKSTIIETLRIMLDEKTKLESEKKFQKIQQAQNITQENFDNVHQEILKAENNKKVLVGQKKEIDAKWLLIIDEQTKVLEDLKTQYEIERRNLSWFGKIIAYFKSSPLKLEINEKAKGLDEVNEQYDSEAKEIDKDIAQNDNRYDAAVNEAERLKKVCEDLEPHADGQIIGNGASDFTKTNCAYKFNIDGIEFDLIDVPGIEGNESMVTDSIMEAVQKAHAVFYVTRKPAAPQSGEDGNGTLEKIKQHLGAQTEVWAIFNQAANNPVRLQRPIVSDDELASLDNMNNVIRDKLGVEHYRGNIVLSAYPAFLAVAKCLVPGSKDISSKIKFLKQFDADDLLVVTKIKEFIDQLPRDIIGNWKEKIIQSNYNKAAVTIAKAISSIEEIQNLHFKPLEASLNRNAVDSKRKIDNGLNMLEAWLNGVGGDAVSAFKSSVRGRIYEEIDGGISNDLFEEYLEDYIKEEIDKAGNSLTEATNKECEKFQKQIEEIVEKNKENMEQILDKVSNISNMESFNINLKIDIDNGIKKGALIGVVGAIAGICMGLVGGPIGWVFAGISLVSAVWSAFRGFLSSDYKKRQQRKNADENIRKIANKLEDAIISGLCKVRPELQENINEIKKHIDVPVSIVKNINKELTNVDSNLKKLIVEIKGATANEQSGYIEVFQ